MWLGPNPPKPWGLSSTLGIIGEPLTKWCEHCCLIIFGLTKQKLLGLECIYVYIIVDPIDNLFALPLSQA